MAFSPIATAAAKSLQSCPTLCNPIDSSPPGSPIPGILYARILEWVAISFSNRGQYFELITIFAASDLLKMQLSLHGKFLKLFQQGPGVRFIRLFTQNTFSKDQLFVGTVVDDGTTVIRN